MAAVEVVGLADVTLAVGEVPAKVEAIARQTLNRTANKGRTEIKRVITGEVNLRSDYVLSRLTVIPATLDRPEAKVFADRDDILLSRFGARATGIGRNNKVLVGISVQVGKNGGRKRLPFAVLIQKNGVDLLLAKRRTRGPNGGKYRVLYGPSVTQVFNTTRASIALELQAYATAEMERRLAVEKLL